MRTARSAANHHTDPSARECRLLIRERERDTRTQIPSCTCAPNDHKNKEDITVHCNNPRDRIHRHADKKKELASRRTLPSGSRQSLNTTCPAEQRLHKKNTANNHENKSTKRQSKAPRHSKLCKEGNTQTTRWHDGSGRPDANPTNLPSKMLKDTNARRESFSIRWV